jgi:hypothetical protein
MVQRDHLIADLRRQLALQSAEIGHMKISQDQLENDLQNKPSRQAGSPARTIRGCPKIGRCPGQDPESSGQAGHARTPVVPRISGELLRSTAKVTDLIALLHDRGGYY